jgi:hypothetical protein
LIRWLVLVGGLAVVGCGGGAGSPSASGNDYAGYVDAGSLAPDASSVGADGGLSDASISGAAACGDPAVTNVQANDAAGLSSGCTSAATSVCTSVPRVTFACPVVRGPADSGAIAPGDTITVGVLMTNTVELFSPCLGLTVDPGAENIVPDFATVNSLTPTRDFPLRFTVVLPPSLTPGSVIHFVVFVVLSPCPGDAGALEFDVRVG